jgi:hypothetical protein
VWTRIKTEIRAKRTEWRKQTYMEKIMQCDIFKGLDEQSYDWLSGNIDPKKVSAIINMQEQMVETRAWKMNRGLIDSDRCRLCGECAEGVMHLASGCKVMAGREYLSRHNNVLKILMTAWCKENGLMPEDTPWYKVQWVQGAVLENELVKMSWDFTYCMRRTTTARRPDITIEYKEKKRILLLDMACLAEKNVQNKITEKRQKYQ